MKGVQLASTYALYAHCALACALPYPLRSKWRLAESDLISLRRTHTYRSHDTINTTLSELSIRIGGYACGNSSFNRSEPRIHDFDALEASTTRPCESQGKPITASDTLSALHHALLLEAGSSKQ